MSNPLNVILNSKVKPKRYTGRITKRVGGSFVIALASGVILL